MKPEITNAVAGIDLHHWLYRYRADLLRDTLATHGFEADGRASILDVGCGSGATTLALQPFGQVTAVDSSATALDWMISRAAGIRAIHGDIQQLDQATGSHRFDLVTCFHVLYHEQVTDVARAIAQMVQRLKPGGLLIIEEPADGRLRRKMDRIDSGVRRFSLETISQVVQTQGMAIEVARYLHGWAWPIARMLAWRDRAFKTGGGSLPVELRVTWSNNLLYLWSHVADRYLKQQHWPVGTACWLVARRHDNA